MKIRYWIFMLPIMAFATTEGRFMEDPDISEKQIVFTYESDLWLASVDGGLAIRLTTHPGTENAAKISPDGQWIAFSGQYDMNTSVYLIPIEGGTPKRLTYSGNCRVVSWTPDSKRIIFRSALEASYRPIERLYSVSINGSWSEPLPVPRGVLCSFSKDGKQMVYNPRGREEYYWKRYKGGQYMDIWHVDFESSKFTQLTDYVGKNAYPMWIGDSMVFVSDRGDAGISNLYRYDFKTRSVNQITRFDDVDLQSPSTDGATIVFLHAGYIHILDLATANMRKVPIRIPTDAWTLMPRTISPVPYIHSMEISSDGQFALFEARGDVFLVPADRKKKEEIRNITATPGTRERYPAMSPDGNRIAFFSDKSGEYELYVTNVTGESEWVQLTNGLKNTVYPLKWSPDGQHLLFGDKDFTLFVLQVQSKKLIQIDSSNQLKNDEFYWQISDYTWSPDSRWIAYSFVQYNRNSQIFLYELGSGRKIAVTDDFYDCLNPSFDLNGDFLYFLSYRNFDEVRMDVFEDNHVIPNPVQVMAVQLRKGLPPPFESVKTDQEYPDFHIDTEGIQDRIFSLPVEAGNYFYLKAGKGIVTWASTDGFDDDSYDQIFTPGEEDRFSLHLFNSANKEHAVLIPEISDWRISLNGKSWIVKKLDAYYTQTLDQAFGSLEPGDYLDLSCMNYTVHAKDEWNQIFNDTWRWYRDFFYDPEMHGRDWNAIGERYRSYLPEIHSRRGLNWLLEQMVGELCVSHTYVSGGDTGPDRTQENRVFTGLLAADYAPSSSGYYLFKRLYGPTSLNRDLKSPLVRPDIDLQEGDYLIAINGREIRYPEDPARFLQVTEGEKIRITVNRKPLAKDAKTYIVTPIRSEQSLRYHRWIEDNLRYVQETGKGQIGYMHITAMGAGNVAQFDKYWRAFRYKKGLIIDVRGNRGGWTEYFLIDKLERKMVAYNCLKNMVPFRYPGSVSNAHLAVVTNEYNGSDGEAFVEHFKARKLGTVIGIPSWGGLVGILNRQTTIDGGSVQQSNNSFYGIDGEWWVENHGAEPDIWIENDPASVMQGHDNQLETAVEMLLKRIVEEPYVFPKKPEYPKR